MLATAWVIVGSFDTAVSANVQSTHFTFVTDNEGIADFVHQYSFVIGEKMVVPCVKIYCFFVVHACMENRRTFLTCSRRDLRYVWAVTGAGPVSQAVRSPRLKVWRSEQWVWGPCTSRGARSRAGRTVLCAEAAIKPLCFGATLAHSIAAGLRGLRQGWGGGAFSPPAELQSLCGPLRHHNGGAIPDPFTREVEKHSTRT